MTLHLDPEVMAGGSGCCTVAGGDGLADTPTAVPVTSARRILCDAAMESLLDDGNGNEMRLGRRSRVVRGRLRRAVRLRDGGCRFPGCSRRGWLDAHHIIHWLDDGLTDLENLLSLCRFHHRRVHEGGWTIDGDPTGTLTFVNPTGRTVTETPPIAHGDAAAVAAHHRSATDGRCQWTGERLDMNLTIGSLQHAETIAAGPARASRKRERDDHHRRHRARSAKNDMTAGRHASQLVALDPRCRPDRASWEARAGNARALHPMDGALDSSGPGRI